jgi:hypothetical protein
MFKLGTDLIKYIARTETTAEEGLGYGRSFESVRMGAKEVSARWLKAS